MRTLFFISIFKLNLLLSFLIYGEETKENFTAETLVFSMFRNFSFSEEGEKFLLKMKGIEYFYCEGKGSTIVTSELNDEQQSSPISRMEFIFAFREDDKDNPGWFAISEPSMLNSSWLVVAIKPIGKEDWKNIWDSEFSIVPGQSPFEDLFKATLNEFILRLDVEQKIELQELQWRRFSEGAETARLSIDWYISMNRNTNSFYWLSDEKDMVRFDEFPDMPPLGVDKRTIYEGDCSLTRR